jgi:hypothetical protein
MGELLRKPTFGWKLFFFCWSRFATCSVTFYGRISNVTDGDLDVRRELPRPAKELFHPKVGFLLLEQVCNLLRNVLWSNLKRYGRGCKPRPAKELFHPKVGFLSNDPKY